jgi:hypothetical protein
LIYEVDREINDKNHIVWVGWRFGGTVAHSCSNCPNGSMLYVALLLGT